MTPAQTPTQIHEMGVARIGDALAGGELTSRQVIEALFERIDAVEAKVQAFLTLTREDALAQADAADVRLKRGERGPMLGVPIGLKDIFCTKGTRTTCASRMLENFVPPYDATVVAKLRAAGAVFPGKLNMDEFAMGSSCENSAYHPTFNPWDLERSPGGSSGGSAAAVAASMVPAALGTDTGGSIKQPASLCGIVGVRPTYGRVSRYGMIAFASSLDQAGPLTRDVRDAAIVLGAIAGPDPRDSTTAPGDVPDFTAALGEGVRGMKLGLPKEYFVEGIDPQVENAVRAAADRFVELGAEIVEISLPYSPYGVETYYLCASAEASSNLARYDGAHYGHRAEGTNDIIEMFTKTRNEGFGPEVKRRIMLGTYALSAGFYDAYYMKALKMRTLMRRDFDAAFARVDAIVTPTSPTGAFKIGEKVDDPLQMYLNDIFTIPANMVGMPGMSLPCGMTGEDLPIGLQILTPAFEEGRMLRVAYAYEQATEWHEARPGI